MKGVIFGKFTKILEDDHLLFLVIEVFYILELGADRADVSDSLFLPQCHLSCCALGREAYVAQELPSSCISDAVSKIPFRLRTLSFSFLCAQVMLTIQTITNRKLREMHKNTCVHFKNTCEILKVNFNDTILIYNEKKQMICVHL